MGKEPFISVRHCLLLAAGGTTMGERGIGGLREGLQCVLKPAWCRTASEGALFAGKRPRLAVMGVGDGDGDRPG
jgi:hypothetical protein